MDSSALIRIQVRAYVFNFLFDVYATSPLGSLERQVFHVVRHTVLLLCLVATSRVNKYTDRGRFSISSLANNTLFPIITCEATRTPFGRVVTSVAGIFSK